jgi:hypothetical protein
MVTGIIYIIICNETNEVYYGSTQQSLKVRMAGHKSGCKGWKLEKAGHSTSYDIIDRGNYSYSLIETVECETKQQLESRERYYIENNECINKNVPAMTYKEYKDYQDAYYKDNKEQRKAYRDTNKDTKKEYDENYRKNNKERRNEQQRQRRAKQKELNLLQQAH